MIAGQSRGSSIHLIQRRTLISLWIAVTVAIVVWMKFGDHGWDVQVYGAAIQSLRAGHDPYADAMAIQEAFHNHSILHVSTGLPYSYVYSPMTLPLLRLIARVPFWFSGSTYWLIYVVGVLGQIWATMQATTAKERRYFLYVATIAAFFPGFLENGTVVSGNIAYILYAAVLSAAVVGWRRGKWGWFYVATLAASCVKAPLLSLVVIPVLSARRQWLPAGLTAAAGVGLFALQPMIWPSLFSNYLKAVNLQFLYNRDFGCSPAGLFSDALFRKGFPYSPGGLIFYLCYAVPLLGVLFYLSRQHFQGRFSLKEWIPVLLVGVVLLNPRIMEYDVAPITIPITLILWRLFARFADTGRTILYLAILFAITNGIAALGWYIRKLVDGPLLVLVFAAGCWMLMRTSTATITGCATPLVESNAGMR